MIAACSQHLTMQLYDNPVMTLGMPQELCFFASCNMDLVENSSRNVLLVVLSAEADNPNILRLLHDDV